MLKRDYMHESLNYVLKIQDVQERIKFEFVEILLGFMSGWLVFYHLGHEVAEDAKEYMTDLQHKVQKVSATQAEVCPKLTSIPFRLVRASQNFKKLLRN
jgi:Rho GTPase-activating protein 26